MCWDCSSVNDDQHIYVEKSENVKGLLWSCQKCMVNKVDVITSLKKIKEQPEEEICCISTSNSILFTLNSVVENKYYLFAAVVLTAKSFEKERSICPLGNLPDSMLLAVRRWPAGGSASGPLEICPSGSPEDHRWQPP